MILQVFRQPSTEKYGHQT